MNRIDGRAAAELRKIKITPNFQAFAEGSVLIEQGKTQVVCAVSLEDKVPPFLRGTGSGWITAEYAMLPRSTTTRTQRDSVAGRIAGRSQEIQRLIGRSLRAVADLAALGERSLIVDCDVLQADAGTRTAAITGSYVALNIALKKLVGIGILKAVPLKSQVAAVSVIIQKGQILLDPSYDEDAVADADFNIVMTATGELVEVQGTAEKQPYSRSTLTAVLDLAESGLKTLFEAQKIVLDKLN